MLEKWEGIVLRVTSYGESNKIITLLTEEAGKISVMARGAKKPRSRLSAPTQLFTHSVFLIHRGKGMGTLSSADTIESMRYIRENLEATAYASYIVEIIDRLTEQDVRYAGIYELAKEALHAINEMYDPEAIALFVEWKMLPVGGIYPILHQCANCGATEGEFGFSFQAIGFLCHRCFPNDRSLLRLTPKQVQLIRTFYLVPIHQIGDLNLKDETKEFMRKIVRTIYDEQIGIFFKSRKFIEQMQNTPALQLRKRKTED